MKEFFQVIEEFPGPSTCIAIVGLILIWKLCNTVVVLVHGYPEYSVDSEDRCQCADCLISYNPEHDSMENRKLK